jgi:HK97 family phage major capsid protein
MPDIDVTGGGSPGTFPIAFGDFRRGYLLVDRVNMRVVVDPYTTLGSVRFYISKRVGGIVLNNDAIKWLRTNA